RRRGGAPRVRGRCRRAGGGGGRRLFRRRRLLPRLARELALLALRRARPARHHHAPLPLRWWLGDRRSTDRPGDGPAPAPRGAPLRADRGRDARPLCVGESRRGRGGSEAADEARLPERALLPRPRRALLPDLDRARIAARPLVAGAGHDTGPEPAPLSAL